MRKVKRHRINLFLLVLTHLLLFVYPTAEKAIHTHRHTDIREGISLPGSATFSPGEKHCAVCEFQFVNFVTTQPPQTTIYQAGHAVPPSSGPTEPFSSLSPYFLLRAPPVSTSAAFCA